VPLPRAERFAAVADVHRLARSDAPRVPREIAPGLEIGHTSPDSNLISRLQESTTVASESPGQSRSPRAEPERIGLVLDGQVIDDERRGRTDRNPGTWLHQKRNAKAQEHHR